MNLYSNSSTYISCILYLLGYLSFLFLVLGRYHTVLIFYSAKMNYYWLYCIAYHYYFYAEFTKPNFRSRICEAENYRSRFKQILLKWKASRKLSKIIQLDRCAVRTYRYYSWSKAESAKLNILALASSNSY